jgi:NOL1/NOP2/fmu family ribosome biogenesis protein
LPGLSGSSRAIVDYYGSRFGVSDDFLQSLQIDANKEEIWGTTASRLEGVHSARPMGLRIGRAFPKGFKPTSVFLAALGPRVRQSRVAIDLETLRKLLLGRKTSFGGSTPDGYVALEYRGDVLGCGRVHHGTLQALIPTGRRKELLDILSSAL